MAITSYSTLKDAVVNWTHRTDLTTVLDDFIDLTESRLNRELRASQQEIRATTAGATEYLAMPTDLLAIRNIQLNTNPPKSLAYVAPEFIDLKDDGSSGEPKYYTIIGDEIQLAPDPDGSYTVEIAYYAKITALSDSNTSNWLLAAHPEAYLYGCLAEAFKYAMDDEQAAKYAALFQDTLSQIKTLDAERKYGQGMRVRAV
jgi:hypothetical protein